MSENALSRRGFLAGSAGVAAVVAAGTVGLSGCAKPYVYSDHFDDAPTYGTANGLCTACPHLCAYTAYVKDNKISKLIANTTHPSTKGSLCARGYSFSKMAYDPERLTTPKRRNAKGEYEDVSWEDVYREVGQKLKDAAGQFGAGKLAAFHTNEPTAAFYATRLMYALGSPNSFGDPAYYEPSKRAGYAAVLGEGSTGWDVDAQRCKALLVFGTGANGMSPAQVKQVQNAHDAGAYVIVASPVRDNIAVHADEWLAIPAGAELALVLGMCNVLVDKKLVDEKFVKANVAGYDDFKAAVAQYTPAWVEQTTGVSNADVMRLAHLFADAKPACAVAADGAFAGGLANSGETCRAIACLNTLLGVWNQPGGALLYRTITPGQLPDELRLDVPDVALPNAQTYPLAPAGIGAGYAALADKSLNVGLFFGVDPVLDGGNSRTMAEAIESLTLSVVVDTRMSETAKHAMYVLPAAAQLEFVGLPAFIDAPVPVVAFSDAVVDPAEGTKPVNVIVEGIAQQAGVADKFTASLDDYANALLDGTGLALADLRQAGSTSRMGDTFEFGTLPELNTPSGKFELTSEACKGAGLGAAPTWVDPTANAQGSNLSLVSVASPAQTNGATAACPGLSAIATAYKLWRVWINPADAAAAGVENYDAVLVSTAGGTQQGTALVTNRVMAGTIALARGFDGSVDQATGETKTSTAALADSGFEAAYGTPLTTYVTASISKAGK